MNRRVLIAAVIVTLAIAGGGEAATTGRMAGSVVDNDGIALPGATVSITSEALIGGPQVAVTEVDGGFVFNLLPVGAYRVEANLPGFQPAAAEIRVALDRVASVTFNLVPEQFGGEIEVVANVPVVDTAQVNTSVVFDQDYLQKAAVGSAGRDYLQIIGQAAGVAGGGNASVFGGTSGDNAYLVDGLNTSDPLLGTFGTNFNYDAIQEVSFQTGGFEAEFGQATGGIINLVTKSGGNSFSGSLDTRYRNEGFTENGDHYDRDDQTSSLRNISTTLGGPLVRDRLWFFVSVENVNTKSQDEGAPVVREFDGWNYIGKATWQVTDSHRLVAKFSGDPADIPGANSSRFIEESAALTQSQGGSIIQLELNSVLSEVALLNAQVGMSRGYIESFPSHGDDTRALHTNEDTLINSNSVAFAGADDRDRDEVRVNLTWFVDDLAGAHEMKVGLEYNDLFYGGTSYIPGGGFFYDVTEPPAGSYQDLDGDGHFSHYVTIKEIEGTDLANGIYDFAAVRDEYLESTGGISTAFLQDAWRPTANLTVKPGVRVDKVVLDNHLGAQVADMTHVQPRFGVAWDIMGDARHVVRGSWGEFMDPTALSIPNFASGVPQIFHEYNTLEFYCNSIGRCDAAQLSQILRTDAIEWTSAEGYTYTLFDNRATTVYEPAQTLDQAGLGSLKAPFAEELVVAYETQLAAETSLELTWVDKKVREIIEDTCSGNTWVYGAGETPSLDDPTTWTRADECDFFLIANIPGFYRDYEAAIVKLETRQESFHILASYTWSKSFGNTPNGARESYAGDLADFYPVEAYNREGYLADQRAHRVKLSGYALLPWDITLGLDSFWSSAGRLTPNSACDAFQNASADQIAEVGADPAAIAYCSTGDGVFLGGNNIFLLERGAVETKSVWQVDMQVSKSFQVGSVDLTGVIAVYNLFDRELDASFNSVAFRTDAVGEPIPVGAPTSYWEPRRYELGLRLEF